MDYYYCIAGKTIMFSSEAELLQNGFSPLFAVEPCKHDIKIRIVKASRFENGRVIYKTELFSRIDAGGKSVLHFPAPQENRTCAELIEEENGLLLRISEKDIKALSDTYFLWRYIDFGSAMLANSRLILHCSFIEYGGKAILFCGKSGVGKSTQAALWQKHYSAEIINGDKAAVFTDCGKAFAASLPIAGTSGLCLNRLVQLKAVVFLSQGKENRITDLGGIEALRLILSNLMFDSHRPGATEKALMLAGEIIKKVKLVGFSCLPDESAAKELFDYLEVL